MAHYGLPRIEACVLTIALASVAAGQTGLSEAGIDLFGASWHYSTSTYWDGTKYVPYNERNLGIGAHARIGGAGRHVWQLKTGGYEDSKRNLSLYIGPVWQYRVAGGLLLGGGILLFDSKTYASPVLPLPLATYRVGRIGLNATWVPAGAPGESAALAVFGTILIWRKH